MYLRMLSLLPCVLATVSVFCKPLTSPPTSFSLRKLSTKVSALRAQSRAKQEKSRGRRKREREDITKEKGEEKKEEEFRM